MRGRSAVGTCRLGGVVFRLPLGPSGTIAHRHHPPSILADCSRSNPHRAPRPPTDERRRSPPASHKNRSGQWILTACRDRLYGVGVAARSIVQGPYPACHHTVVLTPLWSTTAHRPPRVERPVSCPRDLYARHALPGAATGLPRADPPAAKVRRDVPTHPQIASAPRPPMTPGDKRSGQIRIHAFAEMVAKRRPTGAPTPALERRHQVATGGGTAAPAVIGSGAWHNAEMVRAQSRWVRPGATTVTSTGRTAPRSRIIDPFPGVRSCRVS